MKARSQRVTSAMEKLASDSAARSTSAHEAIRHLGITSSTVRNIVYEVFDLCPYRLQSCHRILPADSVEREAFTRWAFFKIEQNPTWIYNIFWTDEAHFLFYDDVNTYNCNIWITSNPHEHTLKPLYSAFIPVSILGPIFFETQCPVNG